MLTVLAIAAMSVPVMFNSVKFSLEVKTVSTSSKLSTTLSKGVSVIALVKQSGSSCNHYNTSICQGLGQFMHLAMLTQSP